MELDRIIFGDNQFFGINHMSEEKAQAQAERFGDVDAIMRVVDIAYESGIHAFMFTTHDKVADLCDRFRADFSKYSDLRLYPSLPYAHKYSNAVNEKGMIGALSDFLFSGRTAGQAFAALLRGGRSIIGRDVIELMRLLVDAEMRMFEGLNVKAIFLQNIVTDLLLGLKAKTVTVEFANYVRSAYGVDPAFNTMNMPRLVDFLLDCGIENPIVCSAINKIGYFMHPDRSSYERAIGTQHFRPMAMSILASGAVSAAEAVEYVAGLGIESVIFGASSKIHIQETMALLVAAFHLDNQRAKLRA
ncbi:MAG: hypothetical protein ACYSWQ_00380 [Planctomycetota bacterium]|jgi:hypothetical protein